MASIQKKKPTEAHPPKRERAIQQRALGTRHKIIEAAIEEFAKNGYEGASTRTIAANAELQHTLVTYHFKGKEGLWRAAISSILIDYTASFQARLDGLRGVDDATKLRLMNEEFIRFSAQNLNFHRMMSHVAGAPSRQLDWLINEHLRSTFDTRVALIRSAQKMGRYVDGDPYHLEYLFIGAVSRIFMLAPEVEMIMGRSLHDPAFVDEHVRVCLGLFFRDPAPAGARPTAGPARKRPKPAGSAKV